MLDPNRDNFLKLSTGEFIPIDFDYMIIHDGAKLLPYQIEYLNGRKGFAIRVSECSDKEATEHVLDSYPAAAPYLYEQWGNKYLRTDKYTQSFNVVPKPVINSSVDAADEIKEPSNSDAPLKSNEVADTKVNEMIESLKMFLSTSNNDNQLELLLRELLQHSENFLEKHDLPAYKEACKRTLLSHEKELSYENGAPRTIYEHISAACRALFNLLDTLMSSITGQQTMAETHNPLARFFTGNNYFLSPPKPTPLAEEIQRFTDALDALQHDSNGLNPSRPAS